MPDLHTRAMSLINTAPPHVAQRETMQVLRELVEERTKLRAALEHIRVCSPCNCASDYTSRGKHGPDCLVEQRETAEDALREAR